MEQKARGTLSSVFVLFFRIHVFCISLFGNRMTDIDCFDWFYYYIYFPFRFSGLFTVTGLLTALQSVMTIKRVYSWKPIQRVIFLVWMCSSWSPVKLIVVQVWGNVGGVGTWHTARISNHVLSPLQLLWCRRRGSVTGPECNDDVLLHEPQTPPAIIQLVTNQFI